jgi:hypothetical protein
MHDDLLIPILVAILAGHAEAQRYAYSQHEQSAATQPKNEAACSQRASSHGRYDPAHPTLVVPISSKPVTVSGSRAKATPAGGAAPRMRDRQAADARSSAVSLHAAGLQGSYYRTRQTCLDRSAP